MNLSMRININHLPAQESELKQLATICRQTRLDIAKEFTTIQDRFNKRNDTEYELPDFMDMINSIDWEIDYLTWGQGYTPQEYIDMLERKEKRA